ncbi:hypothetical protein AX777_05890 [Sphingobium yanoikuyae]|uniref:Uncharacterized protein n=1 Tax=Sphingobium yanoikuyae TaxID=13690 RepID=A0A177JNX6_SPHYA|nr:hypothetical protein [Sphingobium yanoikuyae]OAH42768.1 hypothetical protein AX777_05890 [Sphingobium yanoikuyae]
MSKFKLPTPVVDDAKWTEIWKDGESFGQFKVKYQDTQSAKWNLQYKRIVEGLSKSERHRADNPKNEADVLIKRHLFIQILAAHYIVDSKMVAADGSILPHNMADVLELLLTPELYFIAQELDQFSVDEDNFKAPAAAKEAKKN